MTPTIAAARRRWSASRSRPSSPSATSPAPTGVAGGWPAPCRTSCPISLRGGSRCSTPIRPSSRRCAASPPRSLEVGRAGWRRRCGADVLWIGGAGGTGRLLGRRRSEALPATVVLGDVEPSLVGSSPPDWTPRVDRRRCSTSGAPTGPSAGCDRRRGGCRRVGRGTAAPVAPRPPDAIAPVGRRPGPDRARPRDRRHPRRDAGRATGLARDPPGPDRPRPGDDLVAHRRPRVATRRRRSPSGSCRATPPPPPPS